MDHRRERRRARERERERRRLAVAVCGMRVPLANMRSVVAGTCHQQGGQHRVCQVDAIRRAARPEVAATWRQSPWQSAGKQRGARWATRGSGIEGLELHSRAREGVDHGCACAWIVVPNAIPSEIVNKEEDKVGWPSIASGGVIAGDRRRHEVATARAVAAATDARAAVGRAASHEAGRIATAHFGAARRGFFSRYIGIFPI